MSATIGQQLREAREARSLTLEQVAQATHMRVYYLQALESGELSAIPSGAQARGFLRAYADFLNLNAEPLLADLDGGLTNQAAPTPIAVPEQTPDVSQVDTGDAEVIFLEIGQTLRNQRELLGLSLDDVEHHTHLRLHYLMALEAGDLGGLPSPVQGRGMLKNYSSFLGLDSDVILLRFADGLQAIHAAKQPSQMKKQPPPANRKPTLPGPVRRFFSADVLMVLAVSLGMVAFVSWGVITIFAMSAEQVPASTAPSIADVLLASPTATETYTPEPVTPTTPPQLLVPPTQALPTDASGEVELAPDSQGSVQINVTVHQRAWMRVIVDGEIEFEGRVLPGSAYNYAGESQVELLTGNGAALQVHFNQQDLGFLGVYGQAVERMFTVEGIVTVTPTITLTPTATSPFTATPTVTATPKPGEVTLPALP